MIVLDTHSLYWAATSPRRLSAAATRVIEEAGREGGVWISAVTLYELAVMIGDAQPGDGTGARERRVQHVVDALRATVMEVSLEIAVLATQFPPDFPTDPLDRIIAATARHLDVPLVTKDGRMLTSPLIKTIW